MGLALGLKLFYLLSEGDDLVLRIADGLQEELTLFDEDLWAISVRIGGGLGRR